MWLKSTVELQHAVSTVNTLTAERTEAMAGLKRKSRFKSVTSCVCGCQFMKTVRIHLETKGTQVEVTFGQCHCLMIRGCSLTTRASLKSSGFKCPWAGYSILTRCRGADLTLQTVAVLDDKSCDWGCSIDVMGMQTCSRPPFRSSSSLGGPGSGPGLPLCRHHRASREELQENGPIRSRLRSFSPVLTNMSCSSSCTDAAWISERTEGVSINGK